MKEAKQEMQLIGWRESVRLPKFKLDNIRAKIDTGAKTSSLHAENIEYVTVKGQKYVKFSFVNDLSIVEIIKAPFIEERTIVSSNGTKTIRPVVRTEIVMGSEQFEIELTLINRDMMGFKMLIGREALKGRFLINPGKMNLLKNKTGK